MDFHLDFLRGVILVCGLAIAVVPVFGDRDARKSAAGLVVMWFSLLAPSAEYTKDVISDHHVAVQDARIDENRRLLENAEIRYQAVSDQLNESHARGIERSAIQYNQIQELRAETQSAIAGVKEQAEAEVATVRANLQAELDATNHRVSDIEQRISLSKAHERLNQSMAQYSSLNQ